MSIVGSGRSGYFDGLISRAMAVVRNHTGAVSTVDVGLPAAVLVLKNYYVAIVGANIPYSYGLTGLWEVNKQLGSVLPIAYGVDTLISGDRSWVLSERDR